jgi:hypothetical protein
MHSVRTLLLLILSAALVPNLGVGAEGGIGGKFGGKFGGKLGDKGGKGSSHSQQIKELHEVVSLLEKADTDYKGHRVEAIADIKGAIRALEHDHSGKGKGKGQGGQGLKGSKGEKLKSLLASKRGGAKTGTLSGFASKLGGDKLSSLNGLVGLGGKVCGGLGGLGGKLSGGGLSGLKGEFGGKNGAGKGSGGGKGKTLPQAESDSHLKQAIAKLQAVRGQLGSSAEKAVTKIDKAIQELETALKIN